MVPASPFIDTRRGGIHVRGDLKPSSSPRIRGAQWVTTVESNCGALKSMAPGVAVVLGGVLTSQRSRRRPCGSSGRRGDCCGGYCPPGVAWQSVEGSAGWGLAPVKARTAFEGRAHADRGFCSEESTRSGQHSGWSRAGHVCTRRRRFPQYRHSAGDGRAVTGVGRRDFGHSCYAA